MEFSIASKYALGLINKRRGLEYSYLKSLQAKSIKCAYENDAIIILPTGYGKSLIFEMIPTMRSSKAVIVSPLNAILEEQAQILGDSSIIVDEKLIAGLRKADQGGNCGLFREATYKYILGHPESLLKKEVCDVMCNNNWQTANVSHLFIDEAHCVVNWGKDFRTDFCKISKLRAIFPRVHMVCLTATATKNMQDEITRILGLSNFQIVSASIDRPNLKLTVVKRLPTGGHHTTHDSFTAVVKPYVDELCRDLENAKRTIIYCKLKWCGYGYELACREASRYQNQDEIIRTVSQFHAPCTTKAKQMVVQDMSSSAGKIKLLFATEAYGMGADSPNIDRIVHIGPPTSAEKCLTGLSCDSTLPSHYWKFSHWQLAELRGSGKRMAMCTSALDHQKDEQHSSHLKINLFDENQPGHSKNISSKNSDVTMADSMSTVSSHNQPNSKDANMMCKKDQERDDRKDLEEMLADAFGENATGLAVKSNSNVVRTKETFGLQLDEGISFSPLSSPRGKSESPTSVKSFSQGSLDNYIEIDSDLNKVSSSPSQNQLPFKTPTRTRPLSARKCSSKKSTNGIVKKTADTRSLRMASSETRRNTGKKKTNNESGGESPGTNQPSVRSFFKSSNAKKFLFKKSCENTSILHDSNCVQVTPVCIDKTAVVVKDGNSEKQNPNFEGDHQKGTDVRHKKDFDQSRAKEKSDNVIHKCTAKESKSLTMAKNTKNAFSILMDKSKSQSVKKTTISQSENHPSNVDAVTLMMKAKQWGRDKNNVVQTTSTKPEDDCVNLLIPEPEKKPWGGQRQCPFYKKMPGTGITVDAFSFGTIPDCSAYFLSHFHYDHYRGLTKKFKHPIYCSKITANLVERRLKVHKQYLHALPMDSPTVVEGVEVTLLEANHCPGSVLFLFKLKGGRTYLHTGDFRACTAMESYPALNGVHINQLYLDTTYCDPSHAFPSQQEVIDFAVSTVHKKLKENMKTLIICGSYTIGKERIFTAIAKALNSKICVTLEKKAVLDCLEDSKLQESITLSPNEAKVHVLPMTKLNQKALMDYMATMKNYTEVLAFEPTGWTHSNKITSLDQLRPKYSKNGIHIYGVPYSEHSSYLEMKRFTQYLNPDKILPTVNNGNSRARTKMEKFFKSWMEELKMSNKSQNLCGHEQGRLSSWRTKN